MRRLAFIATVLATTACMPTRGAVFGPVDRELQRRVDLDVEWRSNSDPRVPDAVRGLLTEPLDRAAAVRIAVASNRRLQARYDELGIAASAIASATVLAPTEVDLEYKLAVDGDGGELELSVVQDLLDLLQISQRRGGARAELAAARARAVAATIELIARVEIAHIELVAATQEAELRQTAFDAASAAAEISERMHAAGNTTDLDLARQRDAREQTRIELARAQLEVELGRESLNELLGLSGADTAWSVVGRLPELPATPPSLDDLERDAVAASLELEAIGADARSASARVGVARLRAWLPELGVGVAASHQDEEGWAVGPALQIGLPIFNQQQGPRARANAELRRARNEAAATATELRARARAERQRVLETHAEARHLFEIVLPLRQTIVDETLRQYNAMNASTFELLTARRDLVDAGRQYIDGLRRFWIAEARARALSRGGMPGAMSDTTVPTGRTSGGDDH